MTWYTDLDNFFPPRIFPLYALRDVHPHLDFVSKTPSFHFSVSKFLNRKNCWGPKFVAQTATPMRKNESQLLTWLAAACLENHDSQKLERNCVRCLFCIKLHVKVYLDLRILVPFRWTRGIGWLLPLEWSQCSWNWVPLLALMGTVCVICLRPFLLG